MFTGDYSSGMRRCCPSVCSEIHEEPCGKCAAHLWRSHGGCVADVADMWQTCGRRCKNRSRRGSPRERIPRLFLLNRFYVCHIIYDVCHMSATRLPRLPACDTCGCLIKEDFPVPKKFARPTSRENKCMQVCLRVYLDTYMYATTHVCIHVHVHMHVYHLLCIRTHVSFA